MKEKQKLKSKKGITLVALVVTIIVLIILAGVSISLVLGENGIITKAKYEKQESLNAQVAEQEQLNEAASYLENMGGTQNNNPQEIKTVAELRGGDYFTKKTTVKDSNGNLIEVPEGFKIAEDSGINVTEGIVIEDNDIIQGIGNNRGNQYVWIPVGEKIKKSDGTEVDIILGRYEFADGTNHKAEDGETVLAKGTPILIQNAEDYANETGFSYITTTNQQIIALVWKELTTQIDGSQSDEGMNTTALNLKRFIDSVKENGGYYIARYEASYGEDGKANSKVSNTYIDENGIVPTTEGALWNNITQIDAATASRELYTTVNSDLINSYAWDTAIVYIQEFSGDEDYSYQDGNSINSSLSNTGNLVENVKDEKCKINDIASNTLEWTTEYFGSGFNSSSRVTIVPKIEHWCTARGGNYNDSDYYACIRHPIKVENSSYAYTFRAVLYVE